jgi:predicted negative regulator of RcsB-dependent stress response
MFLMRRMHWIFGLCLGCVLWLGGAAHAQQEITVRSGVHPSYSRLVFDWPGTPDYKVSQTGTTLTIAFTKGAKADVSAIADRDLPNIKNLKLIASDPLTVTIEIPADGRVRHFAAGDRMVLDVYGAGAVGGTKMAAVKETVKETPPAKTKPVAQKIAPSEKERPRDDTADVVPPAPKAEETEEKKSPAVPLAEVATAQPVKPVESETLPDESALKDSHVLVVTTTTAQGMSVFRRGDWLWMVSDDPALSVTPQISGPQANLFGDVARVDVSGGAAFRVRLPKSAHVRAAGGQLVWRIFVEPKAVPDKPVTVARVTEPEPALAWKMAGARRILDVADPAFEDVIKVVTVSDATQYSGRALEFVPVRTLTAAAGMAILPKADDVSIKTNADGVTVTRPADMVFSRSEDVKPAALSQQAQSPSPDEKEAPHEAGHKPHEETDAPEPAATPLENPSLTQIYHFDRWEMGGLRALDENRRVLMTSMAQKKKGEQMEDLLTLAKLNLANNRGQETLGYLRVALMELPELEDNAEFIALRAAAAALAGRPDEAIEDFVKEPLKDTGELGYWKAATLGALEDWAQAITVLPATFDVLGAYPVQIRLPLGLMLSEVALRGGKADVALSLLDMLDKAKSAMTPFNLAAWQYLMGETQRQKGNKDKAEELWSPLIKGSDDYYRAKAGLSLTKLQQEANKITVDQTIDRLEGLRYAWRGDELETLINYRLGQVYIENGDYLKGLSVLRNASTLYPESAIGKEMTAYMTKTFRDVFMRDDANKIKALEAVSIYDEFKELTPQGDEGNRFIERLAERLVEADLLGRSATLLESQVTQRLQGEPKAHTALRLAAIRLLDSKPEGALRALDVAEGAYKAAEGGLTEDKGREIRLLRARALAKMKKIDEAFAVLGDLKVDPMLTRLKVDTAWSAGRWDDAADALNDLILDEDISLTRPLTAYQVDLVLNRAIALNLGGDRVALSTMREKFGDAMKQTDKSQLFDVVTRPRQLGLIGTRENVSSLISEVDMFKDFLDTYKKTKTP